jgi:hypothetical protein
MPSNKTQKLYQIASKEAALIVKTENTKYCMSHVPSPECRASIKNTKKSLKNVPMFEYCGISVTNQKWIHGKLRAD